MSDLSILDINVDNLKQKQYEAFRDFMVARLREVATALKADKPEDVDAFLRNSPAGDGMGTDVQYISFEGLPNSGEDDIGAVLERLKKLKSEL